jgi:predicted extracellular nuclease
MGAVLTAVAILMSLIPATTLAAGPVYINEIQVSTSGTDWEFIEIQGPAGTDLSNYTLVGIESDAGNSAVGRIDLVISLSGEPIPADGFWVGMSPAAETRYATAGDLSISNNSFENSTATYFLVTGFDGSQGDDLDTDDDGLLDSTPWTAVADSVNIRDDDFEDYSYGALTVGSDGAFLPSGTYRCPDAPTSPFSYHFLNFGIPDGTPGQANSQCSEVPQTLSIHEVQGSGSSTPVSGQGVIVEGVVVGDFQGNAFPGRQLDGFYIQEEAGDGDPATSDGIFIYAPSAPDVSVGDVVEVTGTALEYFGRTQIMNVTSVSPDGARSVAPTMLSVPVNQISDWEPYEGMLVTFPQDLYISEFFNFDRFGEIVVTSERQYQPSHVALPGSTSAEAVAEANLVGRITLDDGRNTQNPDPAIHPNAQEFTLTNTFRGGDILQDVTGVMDFAFGLYRIQPTEGATYVNANPRPTSPDPVGGNVRVATFNVLNFFTHLDEGADICGPTGNLECRGADTEEEFQRQLGKLVAGILALDADIVGIQEIENDILGTDADGSRHHDAVLTLVEELNRADRGSTWAWVGEADHYNDYPVRNEIIYRKETVTPVGDPIALADEAFDQTRPGDIEPVGRPPLAQSFRAHSRGAQLPFTVVVNHFKSKGSSCADLFFPDLGGFDVFDEFQANCNLTRVAQSLALLDFVDDLAQDSPGGVMVIGDLNSYAMEDPIRTLEDGGLIDLVELFEGPDAYSFVFDGQLGYLDIALATESMSSWITGLTVFHINADEPDILDYDTTFKKEAQDALYEPKAYRVSDHDPVIVGLEFGPGARGGR